MKSPMAGISLLLAIGSGLAGCAPGGTAATAAGPAESSRTLPGIRYEAHLSAGGVAPAGNELKNPHADDPNAAQNGATLFVTMNCDGCHGGEGAGWVGPSLADGRWRYGGADDEVFASIYYGRPKGMPAFGGALTQEGIWTLVAYLKSLHAPATVPTQSWEQP